MRVGVILLSWKRPQGTYQNLKDLDNQTLEGFRVAISNSNPDLNQKIKEYADKFKNLDIQVINESNEYSSFRRFFIAREMAKDGIDVIFFIDDDIIIPKNYIEKALEQYQPKTYGSCYTWTLDDDGSDYYKKRTRVYDNDSNIKYCGAGISMVDASIFLQDELFNAPQEAYAIDDLWLSYYADHVAGYNLRYIDVKGVVIGGGDSVALYRQVSKQKYTKKDFLLYLVSIGWKV